MDVMPALSTGLGSRGKGLEVWSSFEDIKERQWCSKDRYKRKGVAILHNMLGKFQWLPNYTETAQEGLKNYLEKTTSKNSEHWEISSKSTKPELNNRRKRRYKSVWGKIKTNARSHLKEATVWGWEGSPMVQHLPTIGEVLCSIPSSRGKNQQFTSS
jgi:hypothetical protein